MKRHVPVDKRVAFLQEAERLISLPDGWTRGAPARDARGKVVDFDSQHATQYCAFGAICKATARGNLEVSQRSLYIKILCADLAEAIACSGSVWDKFRAMWCLRFGHDILMLIARWNDRNCHNMVVATFKKAIEALEAEAEVAARR